MTTRQAAKLFSSFQLGPLALPSRLVMCPMTTRFATDTGAVSPRMLDYYRLRAGKGLAIVIVEASYVTSERPPGNLSICADHYLPGLNSLAETIKENGSHCFIQLNHSGLFAGGDINTLTGREISRLIRAFSEAAFRAQAAGFDGVEIHGGNVYLLYRFFSPLVNTRRDEFGGDLVGRMRFPLQVLEACRSRVGDAYPISFRFNGDEFFPGGWDLNASRIFVKELERRNATLLNVTAGGLHSRFWHVQPMALGKGCLAGLAGEIKAGTSLPVMAVGRINDPETAERLLATDRCDLVGVGRALLADEDFCRKAANGDAESIRRCIGCNQCRMRIAVKRFPVHCTVNPRVGRETEATFQELRPATGPKNVWVVGGGPAGMAATAVLEQRGFQVTLFECGADLGGQLQLARIAPRKEEVATLIHHLEGRIGRFGATVRRGTRVTRELVVRENPDVVIIATGAQPIQAPVPVQGMVETTCWDILKNGPRDEESYVIVGGGLVGCETAEFLAEKGKTVHIVELMPEILNGVEPNTRQLILQRLDAAGVKVSVDSRVVKAQDAAVWVQNRRDDVESRLSAQVIAFALGARSDTGLLEALQAMPLQVFVVGDARKPRGMAEAIFEGTKVALEL